MIYRTFSPSSGSYSVSVPLRGNVNNDNSLLICHLTQMVSVPLRGNVNNDLVDDEHLTMQRLVSVPLRGNVNNDSIRHIRRERVHRVSVPLRGNVNNDYKKGWRGKVDTIGFRPLTGKCK